MKNILKNRIIEGYQTFLEMEKIISEKNTEIKDMKEKIQGETLESVEDAATLFTNIYVDFTLLINDSKINFNRLFFNIDLFKELGFDGLPAEIVEFYNNNRFFVPKEAFVIKDGKAIEREEGSLEKERKKFMEGDFFKSLMNAKSE